MRGITCRRIGQSGLSRSIRLKKCGVTASESLFPESKTPERSSLLSARCCSSCASVVTRFLSCHFQSFQSAGSMSGQYPGVWVTNDFSERAEESCIGVMGAELLRVGSIVNGVKYAKLPCFPGFERISMRACQSKDSGL